MRKSSAAFGLFILTFLLCAIVICWHQLGSGFRLQKVAFTIPTNQEWDIAITPSEKEKIKAILSQKFYYLNKGRQSYVFESEDNKYVLKLFRYHLARERFSLYIVKYIKFWDKEAQKRLLGKRRQFENWMESYKLAFDQLKEETGLLYMHLNKTKDWNHSIEIVDSFGRSYHLPLDEIGFLVQKKADLFSEVVHDLIKKRDRVHLKQVFQAYFKTIAMRHQKGIINKDHCWVKNYGIIGYTEAVEIDVGRYSVTRCATTEKELAKSIYLYTTPFREFIQKKFPEAMEEYHQALEEEAKNSFKKI